jgi:hypothetical protein
MTKREFVIHCVTEFMDAAERGELSAEDTAIALRFQAALDQLGEVLDG